jgi:hypothetical protein
MSLSLRFFARSLRAKQRIFMNRWRRGFEVAMWNSRLVAVFAVIPSIAVGMALFCINAIESLRVLPALLRFADPTMAMDQREALLKQGILRGDLGD